MWSYIRDELSEVGEGSSIDDFMLILKSRLKPNGHLPAPELLTELFDVDQGLKNKLSDLHSWVLEFLGDDHNSTDHEHLSFECGVLATVDWLVGANSIYAEHIKEALEEWEADNDSEDQSEDQ